MTTTFKDLQISRISLKVEAKAFDQLLLRLFLFISHFGENRGLNTKRETEKMERDTEK